MFSLTTTPCVSLWPLLSRLLATRRDLDAHEGRNKQKKPAEPSSCHRHLDSRVLSAASVVQTAQQRSIKTRKTS